MEKQVVMCKLDLYAGTSHQYGLFEDRGVILGKGTSVVEGLAGWCRLRKRDKGAQIDSVGITKHLEFILQFRVRLRI